MNYKEKLIVQVVICMMIFAGVRAVSAMDIKGMRQVKAFVGEHFQKNYTAEDIKTAGSRLVNEAGELRTDITSVVLKANKAGEVKEPLGKADKDGLQMVYAVNGGTVTAAAKRLPGAGSPGKVRVSSPHCTRNSAVMPSTQRLGTA